MSKHVDSISYESAQESLGLSDEGSQGLGVMYDSDIRNAELVIDEHHNDPFEVMRIQTYDDAPMVKGQVSLQYERGFVFLRPSC